MVVRFFPLATTQFARARACSTVIGVSTRTASRSPEIRVDEIGGHGRSFSPGGQIARHGRYAGRQEHVPAQGYFLSGTFGVGSTAVGLSVHRTGFSSDWPSRGRYESCAEGIR